MNIEVNTTLSYQATVPSTLLLNIQPYRFEGQLVVSEDFQAKPTLESRELLSESGERRLIMLQIPEPTSFTLSYKATVATSIMPIPADRLDDVPISKMPVLALSYLNPSRYCQSDQLYKFAYNIFGKIDNGFERVIAICDWIHKNVEYNGAGHTTAQTSAYDTITEQIGVCRDFAHLGIAMCRALSIPARYLSAYACQLQPKDFHACFEAYLGGYWIIFDPTGLAPVNGLVKIATGRDAADTAVASSFGNLYFQSFDVNASQIEGDSQQLLHGSKDFGFTFGYPKIG